MLSYGSFKHCYEAKEPDSRRGGHGAHQRFDCLSGIVRSGRPSASRTHSRTGGGGAVGLFVVQLAHRHGAYVIATASSENTPLVKALGADRVIDYKAANFEDPGSG